MTNHFDMAKEMARLAEAGISDDEMVAEMCRKFPTATPADCDRALRIGLDRFEILEEERLAAVRSLLADISGGASTSTIDAATKEYLAKFKASADTLFPKPDKTKS
jgi:hypothetical protein